LSFRRGLLVCSYAVRLAAHPHHPSYCIIFHPNLSYRYETNLRTSRPVGIRFQQFLESLSMNSPRDVPYIFVTVSPWHLPCPTCDLCLNGKGRHQPLSTSRSWSPLTSITPMDQRLTNRLTARLQQSCV
jgi:hypothetical protein